MSQDHAAAKSDRDKGFQDPVESAVWYYIALLNVTAGEHGYVPQVLDKVRNSIGEASSRFQEVLILLGDVVREIRPDPEARVARVV